MAKRDKRARRQERPSPTKVPRVGSSGNEVARSQFRWRVENVDFDGRWGWENSNIRTLFEEVIPKLHNFETMTWSELEGADQHHFVSVINICPEAQCRLADLGHECDDLFSLRLTGRRRVWGPREGTIMKILWWDPDHSVCPSRKKGT